MSRSLSAVATAFLLFSLSLPVLGHEAGDWILRVGAATVQPDESSSLLSTAVTGPLSGTGVGVGNSTQLGLNLVYMYTDRVGIEVLAATPFEHDLEVKGLSGHGFETKDLGSTKHLPPTVTANYFFGSSSFRPYVGVGFNYTNFFSEDLDSFPESELVADDLELDDSWGIAWRAGIDWELDQNWMLNASVWKLDIETDATLDTALQKAKVNVDVDPWVYMISLGYKF